MPTTSLPPATECPGALAGGADARDVTEDLVLGALEEAALFRGLVEQPLVGIYVLRPGRLEYVNPHFARIFGRSAGEMAGRMDLVELLVEEDRPLMRELVRKRMRGGGSEAPHHLRGLRADGEVVELELHATRMVLGGRPAVGGIVLDVTERKRTEAALREREEQLRHSQKLEAVGRLAGGVAHDFNNLLQVIQGTVNLILLDPNEEFPRRGELEEILRATDRAAALTRQLLAFSRKQVLRPKVVNLKSLVDDLQKMMGRVIGEDVTLATLLEPGLGSVRVDPGQLEQVILNLVVNARDAMPGGGRLTIATANAELTAADAERHPYRVVPGEYVRLTVQDTGAGMPEGVLARIFEPFFTTKEPGRGTGLGLSMAYGMIKQSGGYIWAHSRPGRGTLIEVYLPRVERAEEEGTAEARRAIPKGHGTVLLVEDEESVRAVTRRILERGGYTVLEAASGREAVRIFDEAPMPPDLLVTDVIMPEMGGRDLSTHLLARHPELKVVYMSGYADTRGVRRGLASPESNFIQKPFPPDVFLELVQGVLCR
jgi:PAS domain S-box-containing protein